MKPTLFALLLCSPSWADLRYDLVPRDLADGYHVSGSITTDGTLGQLSPANFVSFDVGVSGPLSLTLDSTADEWGINAWGSVVATTGGLWVLDSGYLSTYNFRYDNTYCPACEWLTAWQSVHSAGQVAFHYSDLGSQIGPDYQATTATPLPIKVGSVSAVPEPSPAEFLGIALTLWGVAYTGRYVAQWGVFSRSNRRR